MSLKELKSLAPWNWDSQATKHPPGWAALQDFEKIQFAWRHDAKENAGPTPVPEPTTRERRRSVGTSATHDQGSQTPNASGQGRKAASADRARSLLKRKAAELHTPVSRLQTLQQRDPNAQQHATLRNPNRNLTARQPQPPAAADTPTGNVGDLNDPQQPSSRTALSSLTATPGAHDGNGKRTPCVAPDGDDKWRAQGPVHFPIQQTPVAGGPPHSSGAGPLRPPRWTPAAGGRASGGGVGRGPLVMPSPDVGDGERAASGSSAGLRLWGQPPAAAAASDGHTVEHQVIGEQLSAGRVTKSGGSSVAHPLPSPRPPLFVEATSGTRLLSKTGGIDGSEGPALAGEGGGKPGDRATGADQGADRAPLPIENDSSHTVALEGVVPASDTGGPSNISVELYDLPCSRTSTEAAEAATAAATPLCDATRFMAGGSQHLELTQQPGPPSQRPPLTSPVPLHDLAPPPPSSMFNEPRCALLAADGSDMDVTLGPSEAGCNRSAQQPATHNSLEPSTQPPSQPVSQPLTQGMSRLQPHDGEKDTGCVINSNTTATASIAAAAPLAVPTTGTVVTRPSLLKLTATTHKRFVLQGAVLEGSSLGVPRSRNTPNSSPDASSQAAAQVGAAAAAPPLPYSTQQVLLDRQVRNAVEVRVGRGAKCSPGQQQQHLVVATSTAVEPRRGLTTRLDGRGMETVPLLPQSGTRPPWLASSTGVSTNSGAGGVEHGGGGVVVAVDKTGALPVVSAVTREGGGANAASNTQVVAESGGSAGAAEGDTEQRGGQLGRGLLPSPQHGAAEAAAEDCQRPSKRRCGTTDPSGVQKSQAALTNPQTAFPTLADGSPDGDGSATGAAATCEAERPRVDGVPKALSAPITPQHATLPPPSSPPPPTTGTTPPPAPSPVAAPSPTHPAEGAAAAAAAAATSSSPPCCVPLSQQQLLVLSQLLAHFRATGCRHPAAMTAGELVAAIASFCQSAGVPAVPTNIQILASWLSILLSLERPTSGGTSAAAPAACAAQGGAPPQTHAAPGPTPGPVGAHPTTTAAAAVVTPSGLRELDAQHQQHPHVRESHPQALSRQVDGCVAPQPQSYPRDRGATAASAAAPTPLLAVTQSSQPSVEVDAADGRQRQNADYHPFPPPQHQDSAGTSASADAKKQQRSSGVAGSQSTNSVMLVLPPSIHDSAPPVELAVAAPTRPPASMAYQNQPQQPGARVDAPQHEKQHQHRGTSNLVPQTPPPGTPATAPVPMSVAMPTAVRSCDDSDGERIREEGLMLSGKVKEDNSATTTTTSMGEVMTQALGTTAGIAVAGGALEARPSRPSATVTPVGGAIDSHSHTLIPSFSTPAGGNGGKRTPGPAMQPPPAPFRLTFDRLSSSPSSAPNAAPSCFQAPTQPLPASGAEPAPAAAPPPQSGPSFGPNVAPLPILPLDTGLPPAPTPLDSLASDWHASLSPAVIALHHLLTHSQQALRSALQAPPPPTASGAAAAASAAVPQLLPSQQQPQQKSSSSVLTSSQQQQEQQRRPAPLRCASFTAIGASAPTPGNPPPDGSPPLPPSASPLLPPPAHVSSSSLTCPKSVSEPPVVSSTSTPASLPGGQGNGIADQQQKQQQPEPQQLQQQSVVQASGPQALDQRRSTATAVSLLPSSAVTGASTASEGAAGEAEISGPAAASAAMDAAAAFTMAPPRRPTLTAPGWPAAPPRWQQQQQPRQGRQQQQQGHQQQHTTASSRQAPPLSDAQQSAQQLLQQQHHPQTSSQLFHHPAACMWPPPALAAACCIPPSRHPTVPPTQTQPRQAATSNNQQQSPAGRNGTPSSLLSQPQPPSSSSSSAAASAWPMGAMTPSTHQLTGSGTNPTRQSFPSNTSVPVTGPMPSSSTAAGNASAAMSRSHLSCSSSHAHLHWPATQRAHTVPSAAGLMPTAPRHPAYPQEGPFSGTPRQGSFGAGSQIAPKPAPSPAPNPALQQLQQHQLGEEYPSANALLQPSPSPLMSRGYPPTAGPYGYPAPTATHAHWPYMHPYGWCSSYGTRRSGGSGPTHSLHRPPSDPSMPPPVYAPSPYAAYGHMHMAGGGGGPAHYGPVPARAGGGGGGGGILRAVVSAGSGGGCNVPAAGGQLPPGGAVYGPVRHGRMRLKTAGPGPRSALPPGFTGVVRGQGPAGDRGMGPPGSGMGWGTG